MNQSCSRNLTGSKRNKEKNMLKIGDVVKLKSGGPLMTISHFTLQNHAVCLWFNGLIQSSGTFATEVLQSAVI